MLTLQCAPHAFGCASSTPSFSHQARQVMDTWTRSLHISSACGSELAFKHFSYFFIIMYASRTDRQSVVALGWCAGPGAGSSECHGVLGGVEQLSKALGQLVIGNSLPGTSGKLHQY
eukprot:scaffold162052_cov20-Prasinocladus_malaysianus.AAC.1